MWSCSVGSHDILLVDILCSCICLDSALLEIVLKSQLPHSKKPTSHLVHDVAALEKMHPEVAG